jgi:hypothetical protein
MTKAAPIFDADIPVTDYRLNDGSTSICHLTEGCESETKIAVDLNSNGVFPAPFSDYQFSLCPGTGGIRFSIFFAHKRMLICAIANEERAAKAVWRRMNEACFQLLHGAPDFDRKFASAAVKANDPENPVYYLKHGCPDLIRPGVQVACPARLPFLATMISPPWHHDSNQPAVKQAFALRNSLAFAIWDGQFL